jgi:hypothetical protein
MDDARFMALLLSLRVEMPKRPTPLELWRMRNAECESHPLMPFARRILCDVPRRANVVADTRILKRGRQGRI